MAVRTKRTSPIGDVRSRRITSLDWARGLLILANLVMIAYLYPSWEQLKHPQWLGVTAFDLIFPTFVTLSGCGLAFAYARRIDPWATARRMVVLFGAGLLYNAATTDSVDPSHLRWFGPLQVYAVLVLVVALLHLVVHRVRTWVAVTIGLAAVWTAASWAFYRQCPTGAPTRSCNLSAVVDLRLFPAEHLYRQSTLGHDPEGLAAMAGALLTMLVGVTAGKVLLARADTTVTVTRLVAWLVGVALVGALAAQVVVPFKRVWSPSFAMLAATVGLTLLIIGYVLYDRPTPQWWQLRRERLAEPFVAMGRNALVLYFGAHLVLHQLYVLGDPPLAVRARDANVLGVIDARLLVAVPFVSAFVALAWGLHRRRIYIHA